MPAKEIKELRLAGKLEEAYVMAKSEFEGDSENIWTQRNLSWVLYSQLDQLASNLDGFILKLKEVIDLNLPESEEMFFDNLSIVISKAARAIANEAPPDIRKVHRLFDEIKNLPLKRNSKWFSVLFSALHKGMKESDRYLEFADWWDFENFRPEDYQKEKMSNGREIMAIAEQGYIAYSKHLLTKQNQGGDVSLYKAKAESFLPTLSKIVEDYPQMQYPAYFKAKLLLALGNKSNMLEALLPFAKKKRNDFWVWEILSEAFSDDSEKVFACYCKALSCMSPEEMLVGLRQKMAKILIDRACFNEARTEIELLLHSRLEHGYKIPAEVNSWIATDWFKVAVPSKSNLEFYKSYVHKAEALLFNDVAEETVIVEFVNSDKKILNFVSSETKFGFFKYERFFSKVKVGDTLMVRFQGGSNGGMHQVFTAIVVDDEPFRNQFVREIHGIVKVPAGKLFGFIDDAFIHPAILKKYKLVDGVEYKGKAIKSYNVEKKKWGWKLF